MAKYVYKFSENRYGTCGGKGANLAEMTKLGLPVPRVYNNNRGMYEVL